MFCLLGRLFSRGCGKQCCVCCLMVDTRLWIVFKIDMVCVRFHMCPCILATATRHMQQTWLDTYHYERLDLHSLWVCLSNMTGRVHHWARWDAHYHKDTLLTTVILFTQHSRGGCGNLYIVDRHSTLQGGAPVMMCVYVCTLVTWNIPFPE